MGVLDLKEQVLDQILKGIREIRSEMVTKNELIQELQAFATKGDLQPLATSDALDLLSKTIEAGFADMKHLLHCYQSENITADEKLLEAVRTSNEKLEHHFHMNQEPTVVLEHRIDILHRRQLKLETDIDILKKR
jgi:hypothetical protein